VLPPQYSPFSTHKVSLWCARAARCIVHIRAILAAEWGPTPAQRCCEQDTVHPVPASHRVRGAARRLRVAPHVPVRRLASNGRTPSPTRRQRIRDPEIEVRGRTARCTWTV